MSERLNCVTLSHCLFANSVTGILAGTHLFLLFQLLYASEKPYNIRDIRYQMNSNMDFEMENSVCQNVMEEIN